MGVSVEYITDYCEGGRGRQVTPQSAGDYLDWLQSSHTNLLAGSSTKS